MRDRDFQQTEKLTQKRGNSPCLVLSVQKITLDTGTLLWGLRAKSPWLPEESVKIASPAA